MKTLPPLFCYKIMFHKREWMNLKVTKTFVFLWSHAWLPGWPLASRLALKSSCLFRSFILWNIYEPGITIYLYFLILKFYMIMNLTVWKGQVLFCVTLCLSNAKWMFLLHESFLLQALKTGQMNGLFIPALPWGGGSVYLRILVYRNFSPKTINKYMLYLLIALSIHYIK